MLINKMAVSICLLLSFRAICQDNFSYTPQHPRPGDVITITYEPAGAIAGTTKALEASYYALGNSTTGFKYISADDLQLSREGKKYTATFSTDTASRFIFLSFSADKLFDNNFSKGYYILLENDSKPLPGAYAALSGFYQYAGRNAGLDPDNEKALDALQQEISQNSPDRKKYLPQYIGLLNNLKRPDAAEKTQKEIESFLKSGLKTEADYQTLEGMYRAAKLIEQMKMVASFKKEKFPEGKWVINDFMQKFYGEKDPVKSAALTEQLINRIKTDAQWRDLEENIDYYQQQPLSLYAGKKDWEGFQQALRKASFRKEDTRASLFNNTAWGMQEDSTELKLAEELSRQATLYAKKEMTQPSGKKPVFMTSKQWERNRKFTYMMYADTYAMVLYRMGDHKNAYKYAREVARLSESKNPDYNNTYALVAEKALPAKQYKKELEQFVREGKAGKEVRAVLNRTYLKEKGSDAGFEDYITALEKEAYSKMIEELRKSMLNQASPSFALLDLDGNKVSVSDLKGKVIVADFWATWCGPCKASFPAMQKMVSRYKDDPNVRFVFIDTWENSEDKKKNAADFIVNNKYTFHVLLDEDNKVVEQFKVEGIPTKFVIDKNGIIRFKSVGFDGSDDKLVAELTAMIDMASRQSGETKAF